jgi:uncharacterized protein (DUF58 family)
MRPDENAPSHTLGRIALGWLIYLTNVALIVAVLGLMLGQQYLLGAAVFALELIFASSRWLQAHGVQSRRGVLGLFRNVRLTGDGVAFAVLTIFLTIAALNSGTNLLYLIFAILYSTLVVSGILGKMSTGGLTATRILPRAVEAGRDFTARIALRNNKRRVNAFAVAIDDCPFNSPSKLPRRVWASVVKPLEEVSLPYRANIPQRGVARFANVRISSLFPFGFFEQWYFEDCESRLLVWPRMGRLLRPVAFYTPEFNEETVHAAARRGTDEQFRSVREYREGDNPRHIHWKTTARAGKLMVKEFEHRREKHISVYLDTFIKNAPLEPALRQRLELAISFSASLIRDFLGSDYIVHFAMFSPELVVMNNLTDRGQLAHILNRLATAEANRERDVHDLFEATEKRMPRETAVLVRVTRHFRTTGMEERYTRLRHIRVFDASTNDIDMTFSID